MSASQTVGQRIRAARLAKGWTQQELENHSGIARANLARLEAGRHSPRVDTVELLAQVLSVPLAELFATSIADRTSLKAQMEKPAKNRSRSVDAMQLEFFRRLSPDDRLALAEELRRSNLELVSAGIKARRGNISPEELRLEILRLTIPERLFRAAYGVP